MTRQEFTTIIERAYQEPEHPQVKQDFNHLLDHDYFQREGIARLREALGGFMGLVNESHGVAGYHLNGDIAEWGEFDLLNQAQAALAKEETHDKAE